MNEEQNFLHLIANRVAAAKVAVEVLLELGKDAGLGESEQELLNSALSALNDASAAIGRERERKKNV